MGLDKFTEIFPWLDGYMTLVLSEIALRVTAGEDCCFHDLLQSFLRASEWPLWPPGF